MANAALWAVWGDSRLLAREELTPVGRVSVDGGSSPVKSRRGRWQPVTGSVCSLRLVVGFLLTGSAAGVRARGDFSPGHPGLVFALRFSGCSGGAALQLSSGRVRGCISGCAGVTSWVGLCHFLLLAGHGGQGGLRVTASLKCWALRGLD